MGLDVDEPGEGPPFMQYTSIDLCFANVLSRGQVFAWSRDLACIAKPARQPVLGSMGQVLCHLPPLNFFLFFNSFRLLHPVVCLARYEIASIHLIH